MKLNKTDSVRTLHFGAFHYHFFHGTATIHFFFIVGIAVVISIKAFSVAM